MTRLLAAAALLAAGGGLFPTTAAVAEARVTDADLAEIRAVIRQQIDAFRACARRPGRPGGEGSPAAVSFLHATVIGIEDVVQQVQVTDRAGAVWLAYYAMQRQQDGSWRASGCRLVEPKGTVSAAYRPQ